MADIEAVLQGDLRPARKDRILPMVDFDDFCHAGSMGNSYITYSDSERKEIMVSKCQEFNRLILDPDGHYARIEQSFSALFSCNFVMKEPETVTTITEKAYQILTRLPPRPLSLLDFPAGLSPAYFMSSFPDDHEQDRCDTSWETLQVTSSLGTNVIRMALAHVLYSPGMVESFFRDSINSIADLLTLCSTLESQTTRKVDHHSWFVVRAFLWSFWQRALMMYLYSNMSVHIDLGFDEHKNHRLIALEDTFPSPNLSAQEMSPRVSTQGKAKYMCRWAFELLRTQPICIGMDFRLFHERYSQLHRHLDARCNQGSAEPCDGTHSDKCQRFKGMVIVDQSAHDALCKGTCQKLQWDESSYRAVSGARAVSLAGTNDFEDLLRYCRASDKTIAISHVWCHGQGGRPEVGMNKCLHQRYSRIAQGMGCDSYWMDTPCIPQEHELRKEAIREINGVFLRSHATLVCDRDLMQIDTTDLTIELMEAIIATVIVCDWNVRAWTFLEAMRSPKHLQILCKNDRTLSVSAILRAVLDRGRIDLVIYCMLAPHLLPWSDSQPPEATRNSSKNPRKATLEMTGAMLAYRPASRKGDDIVIWSLVFNDEPCYTAEDLWRRRVGTYIHTGFLVSSAPRLRPRGLGWAPASAYSALSSQVSMKTLKFYPAFESLESSPGKIEKEGLVADWFLFEFSGKPMGTAFGIYKSRFLGSPVGELKELDKIRR
jgi:hypothetical protein